MKTAVIAFTRNGVKTAKLICRGIGGEGYTKYQEQGFFTFDSITSIIGEIFDKYEGIVFIGACGIAVRLIAPYIKDKAHDPAVVVVDEKGEFVIPILSGHIGGANELAKNISQITGGTAVITTATDINKKFSVDTFAVKNNLYIGDTKLIKEISSRILNDEKIGFYSDYDVKNIPDCFKEKADVGICISDDDKKPFSITLNLKPKKYILGIGCRKDCENVEESIDCFLKLNDCDINMILAVATIDIKKEEKGIVDFCKKYRLPLCTFKAEELMETVGDFTVSEFVKKIVGADNVCERAVCAKGAKLTVKKTPINGVTLALGEIKTEIDFLKGN